MSSPPTTIKLANYLFSRLKQLGVGAIHGVPGDFNLTLLDYVEPSGLRWVGNANELNAGYAADGYARIKGVGALITTFGVGELSAINAIAGAYAERAAVVHIVGTPKRQTQDTGARVHHTFNDGNYRRFGQMAALVTCAQASLRDPRTATGEIDRVLRMCLLQSRPVYIEVPVDLVDVQVSAEGLETPISLPVDVPTQSQEDAVGEVLERIYAAKQPVILVDGETRALQIVDEVQNLVTTTQWPTWTSPFGKGLIEESMPNVHGIYRGKYGDAKTKQFFDEADLVLCFGPHFSTTNSYNKFSVPKQEVAVLVTDTEIQSAGKTFRDIPAKLAINQLLKRLDISKIKAYSPQPELPNDYTISASDIENDGNITQDKLWRYLGGCLRPGDIVMGETGSASNGVRDMPLPKHSRFFSHVTWLSIGYMLPAAQGAALAQRELIAASQYHDLTQGRTVLFIGDGSFQMTAQELGTIIRLNLDVVLFLINNDGYTIERCIHGVEQSYNDVSQWRYLQAPSMFGASEDVFTFSAKTWNELEMALSCERLQDGPGLRMVEIIVDREDFPPGQLLDMLHEQKAKLK